MSPLLMRPAPTQRRPNRTHRRHGRLPTPARSGISTGTRLALPSSLRRCGLLGSPFPRCRQFFTALAYVAIAQKGETPCIANLRMFPELPVPTLAGAKRLLDLGVGAGRRGWAAWQCGSHVPQPDLPAVLVDFSHRELEEVDWISVTLEDRKGGVLVKHSKYTVVSRARGSTVHRRYSDFEALDNLLRRRFPYRIVLKLPPKGGPMGKLSTPTPEFLEDRRKGLARYLTHLVRHPTLRNDDLVVIFITEPNDVKPRLKTHEKLVKPEIATSKARRRPCRPSHRRLSLTRPPTQVAADPFAFVPPDFMEKIDGMRREIVPIIAAFRKICAVYDRNVKHRWDQEREWRSFSSELEGACSILPLGALGSHSSPLARVGVARGRLPGRRRSVVHDSRVVPDHQCEDGGGVPVHK